MFLKRMLLFFAVNMLIVVTISLILNLLGVQPYLTKAGINYEALAIFCLVWGMGGSFISLLLSKMMAKWMMGVQIVDGNPQYNELIQMVHTYARRAGLSKMPEVGVYEGSELNAFATGPSRSNSLVAVSTGLLGRMNREQLEGVIGHEVAHIANGDMVTMTVVQGIINAFVMFMARVVAFAIQQVMRKDDDEESAPVGGLVHMLLVFVLEMVFSALGMLVVAAFSRHREFKADAESAKIAGKDKMIAALRKLQENYESLSADSGAMSTMKISNKGSWFAYFSSHPPLEDRIEALVRGTYNRM
ncbi:MAG: protease HtpX [Oligoflexia bacterium]|nr:protease HtpX [Oligoflexia bacterium]MBF0365154.1 protease HtpX [Oligoflexia bacterium]